MRTWTRFTLIGFAALMPLTAAALLSTSKPADAFPTPIDWHNGASAAPIAGGGSLYGTGANRDWGITCAMCHINNNNQQGSISAKITPTPAWQSVGGNNAYKPSQKYAITFDMVGAHLGGGPPTGDTNNFALTVEDQNGVFAGKLQSDAGPGTVGNGVMCPTMISAPIPPAATTFMYDPGGKCDTVFGTFKANPGVTQWKFNWTAPGPGAGKLTMFYGAVDGNNNSKSSLDDDVVIGSVKLEEGS